MRCASSDGQTHRAASNAPKASNWNAALWPALTVGRVCEAVVEPSKDCAEHAFVDLGLADLILLVIASAGVDLCSSRYDGRLEGANSCAFAQHAKILTTHTAVVGRKCGTRDATRLDDIRECNGYCLDDKQETGPICSCRR